MPWLTPLCPGYLEDDDQLASAKVLHHHRTAVHAQAAPSHSAGQRHELLDCG